MRWPSLVTLGAEQGRRLAVIAPPRRRPNAKLCLEPSAFGVSFFRLLAGSSPSSLASGVLQHAGSWAHTPLHQVGAGVDCLRTVSAAGQAKISPRAARGD